MNSEMQNGQTAATGGESDWLDTSRAASYVGVSKSLLEKLRVAGDGPLYAQRTPRGKVLYAKSDLNAFLRENRVRSTSQRRPNLS
ncbi:MAG: hypothetical protein QOC72_3957 [Methylobacteriaceae bacterium]|jgi:hypothetical protein|nr:hypothetical protein [Methylobacteriaceae bacterium]